MKTQLARRLGVAPAQLTLSGLFLFLFVSAGILYTAALTAGSSLFLSSLGPERVPTAVPWVFVGSAVVNVAMAVAFDKVTARIRRATAVLAVQVVLGVSLVGFAWFASTEAVWRYYLLAIWLEAVALLSLTLLFGFAGDYFNPRDARRLYGIIAGGLALGTVVGGYGIELWVPVMGVLSIVQLCGALVLFNAFVCVLVARLGTPLTPDAPSTAEETDGVSLAVLMRSRYLQLVSLTVLIAMLVTVVVGFQMQWIASDKPRAELATFFGRFYAWVGGAEIVFQFALVPILLRRLGVIPCLMIPPALVGLASYGLLSLHDGPNGVMDLLVLSAAVNFVRLTLDETLTLPARELLFLPLPGRVRVRAQTLIGGAVAPATRGLGGLALLAIVYADVGVVHLSTVGLVGCVALLATLWVLRRPYRDTLLESLEATQLGGQDLAALVHDPTTQGVLRDLLKVEDPKLVAVTLELLGDTHLPDLAKAVRRVAVSGTPDVAAKALTFLSAQEDPQLLSTLRWGLESASAEVQAAAVTGLCRLGGADVMEEAEGFLESERPGVRHAALVGIARHCGAKGASRMARLLREMAGSDSLQERIQTAQLVGRIGADTYPEMVARLAADAEPAVRRAAIEACGHGAGREVLPVLLSRLDDHQVHVEVVRALGSLSEGATAPLLRALYEGGFSAAVHRELTRVAGRIGGHEAGPALWGQLEDSEPLLTRVNAADALRTWVHRDGPRDLDLSDYDGRLDRLCETIMVLNQAVAELSGHDDWGAGLLSDHVVLHQRLLLSLLALKVRDPRLDRVYQSMFSPSASQRASAAELLDELLPSRTSARVMPLFQPLVDGVAGDGTGLSDDTRQLLEIEGPWARAVLASITAAADTELGAEEARLLALLDDIRTLKKVPLFSALQADYLLEVAETADVREVGAGTRLFQAGDEGDSLYVVCEGTVSVLVGGKPVASLGAGECLGELALLDGETRSAGAQVEQAARLMQIRGQRFTNLLYSEPSIARALLGKLDERVRKTQAKVKVRKTIGRISTLDQLPAAAEQGVHQLVSAMGAIRQVTLFSSLSQRCLASVAHIARPEIRYKGERIFSKGDDGDSLYVMCSGKVHLTTDGRIVAKYGKHAYFGEAALIRPEKRLADAVMEVDGQLLQIGTREFQQLLEVDPELVRALLTGFAQRLRELTASQAGG